MLVNSLCEFRIAHGAKFVGEDDVGSAQKVQLLFVRGDGVQGSCENLAQFCDRSVLRLDCFFMLDKGFKRLDDAVCVCHSVG